MMAAIFTKRSQSWPRTSAEGRSCRAPYSASHLIAEHLTPKGSCNPALKRTVHIWSQRAPSPHDSMGGIPVIRCRVVLRKLLVCQ